MSYCTKENKCYIYKELKKTDTYMQKYLKYKNKYSNLKLELTKK